MVFLNEIVKIADDLDRKGLHEEADKLDQVAKAISMQKNASGVLPFGATGPLNSRHCPDHPGDMTRRLGDNVYQCPRDNKIYDYSQGYKTYDGDVRPGVDPSHQTPDDASFYDSPRRFLEALTDR